MPTVRRPRKKPRVKSLAQRCHEGRLAGGLSISLRATPDEVVGALVEAVGAKGFKVLDVRSGVPPVLEVQWGPVHERWAPADVEALVGTLNSLFAEVPAVKVLAILGEWEDMLQLWCLTRDELFAQLDQHRLDEARNLADLRRLVEEDEGDDDEGYL